METGLDPTAGVVDLDHCLRSPDVHSDLKRYSLVSPHAVYTYFLTSERSEEVPFFIVANGPGKGCTPVRGFLCESCLKFWTRWMKLGEKVDISKPDRIALLDF